jgi:hypothetical protein
MKKIAGLLFVVLLFSIGCKQTSPIIGFGQHFQQHQDYESLKKVVELIDLGADTATVKGILGEPIDMGFDYRYLTDSIGPKGCSVGAVFHINDAGKIDDKWIDEICE